MASLKILFKHCSFVKSTQTIYNDFTIRVKLTEWWVNIWVAVTHRDLNNTIANIVHNT